MANDGTALGALNEIIEAAGGTSDAQTLVPAIEDLGEIIGSGGGGGGGTIADGSIGLGKFDDKTRIATAYIELAAVDSMTAAALDSMGLPVSILSPKELAENTMFAKQSLRLCWISGTTLEAAPIMFYGNLQTQATTLYARGYNSTASGVLGVDESWTIAANA